MVNSLQLIFSLILLIIKLFVRIMVVEQSIKLLPIILDIVTDSILAEEYSNANDTMVIRNSKFTIPSSGKTKNPAYCIFLNSFQPYIVSALE